MTDRDSQMAFEDLLQWVIAQGGGISAVSRAAKVPRQTLRRWAAGNYPQQRQSSALEAVHLWASRELASYPPQGTPPTGLLALAKPGGSGAEGLDTRDAQVEQDSVPLKPGGGVSRWRAPLIAVGAAAVVAAVGIALLIWNNSEEPVSPPAGSREIKIQNKVAVGPDKFLEDVTPAYLSTRTVSRCAHKECEVPETKMQSGETLYVMCRTQGDQLTNADTSSSGILNNPDAHTSVNWYQAQHRNGQTGYISEVYLEPAVRTLALPRC